MSGCLPTHVLKREKYIFVVNPVTFMQISCKFYFIEVGKEGPIK
jgi:hypothetical protein